MYTYVLIFVTLFPDPSLRTDDRHLCHNGEEQPVNRDPGEQCEFQQSDFGKVLAGAISGVLQTVVILGSRFLSYRHFFQEDWGECLIFCSIPARVLVPYAVFGLLSYLLCAVYLRDHLGALVSGTEDISKRAPAMVTLCILCPSCCHFRDEQQRRPPGKSGLLYPFTSGNAMFVRVAMGTVASGRLSSPACCWRLHVAAGFLAGKAVPVRNASVQQSHQIYHAQTDPGAVRNFRRSCIIQINLRILVENKRAVTNFVSALFAHGNVREKKNMEEAVCGGILIALLSGALMSVQGSF